MGFLVFSYRKLHLKRKINELSYRQMVLSQRQQTIANNVSIVQRAMAAQKSNVEQFGKLLSSVAAMKFQSIPGMLQAPTTNPYTEDGKKDWALYQEAQQNNQSTGTDNAEEASEAEGRTSCCCRLPSVDAGTCGASWNA